MNSLAHLLSGNGPQTTEDGRRKTEDGRRKTDDGRRTTDNVTIIGCSIPRMKNPKNASTEVRVINKFLANQQQKKQQQKFWSPFFFYVTLEILECFGSNL